MQINLKKFRVNSDYQIKVAEAVLKFYHRRMIEETGGIDNAIMVFIFDTKTEMWTMNIAFLLADGRKVNVRPMRFREGWHGVDQVASLNVNYPPQSNLAFV
jgi:hypothetical protein